MTEAEEARKAVETYQKILDKMNAVLTALKKAKKKIEHYDERMSYYQETGEGRCPETPSEAYRLVESIMKDVPTYTSRDLDDAIAWAVFDYENRNNIPADQREYTRGEDGKPRHTPEYNRKHAGDLRGNELEYRIPEMLDRLTKEITK